MAEKYRWKITTVQALWDNPDIPLEQSLLDIDEDGSEQVLFIHTPDYTSMSWRPWEAVLKLMYFLEDWE